MKNVYYDVQVRLMRCVRNPRGQSELRVTSMQRYDNQLDAMDAYKELTHALPPRHEYGTCMYCKGPLGPFSGRCGTLDCKGGL